MDQGMKYKALGRPLIVLKGRMSVNESVIPIKSPLM